MIPLRRAATSTAVVANAGVELDFRGMNAGHPHYGQINPEHLEALQETEKNNVKCFPRYRGHVAEFIKFLEKHYPDTHEKIVFVLTEEQRGEHNRFYYGATHDIRYNLLHPMFLKFFISGEKKWKDKEKTVQYGYDHPRRYHDAILKCCEVSDYSLHPAYRPTMKAFLDNLKKEKATAKANAQLDEKDSDKIGFGLVEKICSWCVMFGTMLSIFIWAFILTQ